MDHDIMSQFYSCLNYPVQEKVLHLSRIIDMSAGTKDLQAMFPQLINNIFGSSFGNGWGLRNITVDGNRYEFEALTSFLEPQGPMFRLCYKLLSDPQLKYNIPLNTLPLDLQMTLERGRCPQFYADMLIFDSQSMNVAALSLNPFDYYIFNFALCLVSNSQNKSSWENWNSVYYALACDYLMHFLPSDPNVPVLPHIPHYSGKVPMAAPLQTSNRPLCSPTLLLLPDMTGLNNQHTTTQSQSRNEVWRSETVLQVFIDIWMSVEPFNGRNEMFQRNFPVMTSSPERVRTVRVLVKHLHSFSAKQITELACRSSSLRKYARQIMCARAYHYIKHLVTTWPLDASFRLVMELWLSLIQPWRYMHNTISQDRYLNANNNQEEAGTGVLDPSFTQFISENFPSYTCIFQLVLPRFLRLDLTAYKNAIMLFRLGKVFSQPDLVPILWNLEQAIMDSNSLHHSPESSFNNTGGDRSYTYNGISLQKWVAIAKQAISELNMSGNFEYDPIWSDKKRQSSTEFVQRILSSQMAAEKNVQNYTNKLNQSQRGVWASISHWLMLDVNYDDQLIFEEMKKVPSYLNTSVHFFSTIFGLNESTLQTPEPIIEDSTMEHSSFANSTNFPLSITNKLRSKSTGIQYMGDPDLMPITSYESTIVVRIMYQIATRLNEVYGEQFQKLWHHTDFWGYVAREVLQRPRTAQSYVKEVTNYQQIVRHDLPPRLSLRRLGSYAFIFWFCLGYVIFRMFCCGGLFYISFLVIAWLTLVLTRALLKKLSIISM